MKFFKYILLTVIVTVLVACGGSSSPSNKAPTVNAGKDVTVERNQEVILTGTAKDSDGTIKSYVWKKGSKVLSKKASFKYSPVKVGKETLTLTVTDDDGEKATDKVVINVLMRPFITKWKVNKNSTNSITIPTFSGEDYNYSVDWGDGKVSKNQTGNANHSYKDPNKIYTIKIWGQFPRIYFGDGSEEAPEILSLEQWGDIEWSSMAKAFKQCNLLKGNAKDTPDLSNVTDMSEMFAGISRFVYDYDYQTRINSFNQDIGNWDVSNVINMSKLFYLSDFNQSLSKWDISNVTDMREMFAGFHEYVDFTEADAWLDESDIRLVDFPSKFNQDISSWDISNVTNMQNMFQYGVLSSFNYSNLLMKWSSLNLQFNVKLGVGTTKYRKDVKVSRDVMISNYSWIITDGGVIE